MKLTDPEIFQEKVKIPCIRNIQQTLIPTLVTSSDLHLDQVEPVHSLQVKCLKIGTDIFQFVLPLLQQYLVNQHKPGKRPAEPCFNNIAIKSMNNLNYEIQKMYDKMPYSNYYLKLNRSE